MQGREVRHKGSFDFSGSSICFLASIYISFSFRFASLQNVLIDHFPHCSNACVP